jgi:hypothetical protein
MTGRHHTKEVKELIRQINSGANNHNFKGIKKSNHYGYIMIYCPNHPKAQDGRVLEHRLKVEKYLERYLKSNEFIHHINGKKDNNRLSNLYLFIDRKSHSLYEQLNKIRPDLVKKLKSNLKQIKVEE